MSVAGIDHGELTFTGEPAKVDAALEGGAREGIGVGGGARCCGWPGVTILLGAVWLLLLLACSKLGGGAPPPGIGVGPSRSPVLDLRASSVDEPLAGGASVCGGVSA